MVIPAAENIDANVPLLGWDGKFHDQEVPTGVYAYSIRVVMRNGREKTITGNVTVIR